MAKLLKLRRGTTTQHASFTGAEGEVTVDTTKDTTVVHDGSTAGGTPLAKEDMSNVSSASIAGRLGTDSIAPSKIAAGSLPSDVTVNGTNINAGSVGNSDVNASAAIAGTKISPDFGSQNITTIGDVVIGGANPTVQLVDSGQNPDYEITNTNGSLNFKDTTNNATRISIQSSATTIANNLDCGAGIDVTGSSTMDGTVTINADTTTPALSLQGSGPNFIRFGDDSGGTNGMDLVFRTSPNTIGFETTDAASQHFIVNYNGQVTVANNLDVGAGVDVTGNMTVTGTVDGRDVAADGTKLDGIESGATADQTASEINALLNNENVTCAGLDAGSGLIRTNGWFYNDDSGEGLYNSATTQHFYSDDDDYWNIAGGSGANGLRFRDDHGSSIRGYVYANNSSQIGFLNASGNWSFKCDNSGNVTATGNVTAYSDARLKTDIHTINDALSICGKLRGVSYKWIKDGKASIGVIAQEIEEVLPEVVLTQQVKDPTGETEVKSVDYGKIVGVLINAINELKEEVEELKNAKITG